jgi:hypothetical protein
MKLTKEEILVLRGIKSCEYYPESLARPINKSLRMSLTRFSTAVKRLKFKGLIRTALDNDMNVVYPITNLGIIVLHVLNTNPGCECRIEDLHFQFETDKGVKGIFDKEGTNTLIEKLESMGIIEGKRRVYDKKHDGLTGETRIYFICE